MTGGLEAARRLLGVLFARHYDLPLQKPGIVVGGLGGPFGPGIRAEMVMVAAG